MIVRLVWKSRIADRTGTREILARPTVIECSPNADLALSPAPDAKALAVREKL